MNKQLTSKKLNDVFLIITLTWVGFAILSTLLFLGASLSMKDIANGYSNETNINFGLVSKTGNDISISGLGITSLLFFAISLISFIPLVFVFDKYKPMINKQSFIWTLAILLFILIFTAIISLLGAPYNLKQFESMINGTHDSSSPIVANMIKKDNNKFSLDGGSIGILLVDIVFLATLVVSISNLVVKSLKAQKIQNLNINA